MSDFYLKRCFDLAKLGAGLVSPNPQVGAVIVHDQKIIGEGFHAAFGEAHAEVNAFRSVRAEHQHLLPQSTVYVSLEPCSHFGKTPPCADLRERVRKVVVGALDPNPLVAGRGIQRLRDNGIEVQIATPTPELERDIKSTLAPFFCNILNKKPYTILKWAQDDDKNLGNAEQPIKISNAFTQRLTHKWRAESDAILVGTNTVLIDNPKLDTRLYPTRRLPLRVVLDKSGRILKNQKKYHVLNTENQKTLLVTELSTQQSVGYWGGGISVENLDFDNSFLENLLKILYNKYQVGILFVEGGAALHQSFLENELWNEIRVFENPHSLNIQNPIAAPDLSNFSKFLTSRQPILDNYLSIFEKK